MVAACSAPSGHFTGQVSPSERLLALRLRVTDEEEGAVASAATTLEPNAIRDQPSIDFAERGARIVVFATIARSKREAPSRSVTRLLLRAVLVFPYPLGEARMDDIHHLRVLIANQRRIGWSRSRRRRRARPRGDRARDPRLRVAAVRRASAPTWRSSASARAPSTRSSRSPRSWPRRSAR